MHPDSRGIGNRTRIKQQFAPQSVPSQPFFPPTRGIGENIPGLNMNVLVPA